MQRCWSLREQLGTLTRDGDDALWLYRLATLINEDVGEKPRGKVG